MGTIEKDILRLLAFFGAKDIEGMVEMFTEAGTPYKLQHIEDAIQNLIAMEMIRKETGHGGKQLYVKNVGEL